MRPVGQFGARHAWLSITPEPERELPAAVAALRAGGTPSGAAVEAERARAERLRDPREPARLGRIPRGGGRARGVRSPRTMSWAPRARSCST